MTDQNYTTVFTVDRTPEEVFAAINNVRGWWSGDIDGNPDNLGDEFTYRYQDLHYSKHRVTAFVPGKEIVWHVLEGGPNFVADRTEWTDTEITFEISEHGDETEVRFTHVGLVPDYECFNVCSDAWGGYIKGSLRDLIIAGGGKDESRASDNQRATTRLGASPRDDQEHDEAEQWQGADGPAQG